MGSNHKKLDLNDIVGQRVRKLTVLRFSHTDVVEHADRKRKKYMYECRCDCGNTTFVNRFNLKQKDSASATVSCGCFQKVQVTKGHDKQRGKPRPQVQKPNGESILNTQYAAYKKAAEKRNRDFLLSKDEFEQITQKDCHYCGSAPRLLKKKDCLVTRAMNGVDRVDSALGYTVDNCVPCCKICNYMKLDQSQADFLEHVKKIAEHSSSKNQEAKKKIYLVTGAPGAGKSWVLDQLQGFTTIDSDDVPPSVYGPQLRMCDNPVLTLTVGVSTFIKRNPDLDVKLVVICEELEVLEQRILLRGGQITDTLKRRASRMEKLKEKAEFSGTSAEVAAYLNSQ